MRRVPVTTYKASEIIMSQRTGAQFEIPTCALTQPTAPVAAAPGIYFVVFSGEFAEGDTVTVGSKTLTAIAKGGTLDEDEFFAGTAAETVAAFRSEAITVTGFSVSYLRNNIVLTQSTAGSGTLPTVSTTSETGEVEIMIAQDARGQSLAGEIEITAFTPLKKMGVKLNGQVIVGVMNTSLPTDVSAFYGFSMEDTFVVSPEDKNVEIGVANRDMYLNIERMPITDAFGNKIVWERTTGSLMDVAMGAGFQFGAGNDIPGTYN